MPLEQILAELTNLTEQEREAVGRKLDELSVEATREWLRQWESLPPLPPGHWAKVFEEWTGKDEEDVPEDFSLNHDHCIHGRPI